MCNLIILNIYQTGNFLIKVQMIENSPYHLAYLCVGGPPHPPPHPPLMTRPCCRLMKNLEEKLEINKKLKSQDHSQDIIIIIIIYIPSRFPNTCAQSALTLIITP